MTLLNKTKSNAIFNTYFLIKIFCYRHFTLYIYSKSRKDPKLVKKRTRMEETKIKAKERKKQKVR